MTSGSPFWQLGSSGPLQVFLPPWASAMKPSILPPLMSAAALVSPCGPPAFLSAESWNGLTQVVVFGSGTQTVGTPFRIGIPSAPGKVPKYESNDRFSCMITTTCWIFPAAVAV